MWGDNPFGLWSVDSMCSEGQVVGRWGLIPVCEALAERANGSTGSDWSMYAYM